ncbi:cell envelope integrity protein TolA [Oleiagrimonas soli]|uniref:Colicin import membrane protein n=1 Tax=Oleiagrimonas soli TaxID=1543381 RepID=A0A099CTF3_9GAMM|nr:cell envelope integrity protein TolA [Oleiagrimonas soli]KGI77014.1 hypothetical protein LF63_0112145 [Oleiagrimonas soli]MBB6185474.1 colicin import membrane protein [Oleiagrimonas soli]
MDVADRQATTWGVVFAALLHLGIVAFLLLATISCNTWEQAIDSLGLPKSWNPVTCERPIELSGPVIQATLLGPTGAPLPAPSKVKAPPKPKIAPPKVEQPKVDQDKPKVAPVKTLPPPPKNPDVRDQQKVVAQSTEKADQAKREQREREKQRMSELDAQQQSEIDKLFKQMDAAGKQSQQADRQAQRMAQRDDLKKAKSKDASDAPPNTPQADQAQTGTAGQDSGLLGQYQAAIQNAVTQAWLRPDNIPAGTTCKIDIVQIIGGQVISANVEPSCPFDAAARRSVENAVMRASPLPYRGFEKVFARRLTLHFMVNE